MQAIDVATGSAGPERGRVPARLCSDLAAYGLLDPARAPALERLERKLGGELAHRLVHALSSCAGRLREVRAA
jgi:hypothetical protein